MNAVVCPDVHALAGLLENEAEGGAEYFRHLETCMRCQQTLAELAADESSWGELTRFLPSGEDTLPGSSPSSDPTLERAISQLKNELPLLLRTDRVALDEDLSLSFLGEPDRPGLLGHLGDYEVLEVIGRGGMGVVLKGFDPALQRPVAIKVIGAAALAGSATARRRFAREAKAAAAVSHENIVAVHGVSEEAGLPYLVMQYVAGESLQSRLDRGGPLKVEEIVRIGLQTAQGLAAAHAQGLIHRDIKPANLLLSCGRNPDETDRTDARNRSHPSHPSHTSHPDMVKITDFGLARMVDDITLTQNGVVAGTPEYMAPEQARGEAVDDRADLFSLGSVLYAMCTGQPPFRGSTAVAVLRQVSDEEPAPVRLLNSDVPEWLEALIARLMAKDPEQRFGSAGDVAERLENHLALLRQPGVDSMPEVPWATAVSSVNGRLRFLYWVGIAVVVLSVLVLLRWFLNANPPGSAEEPRAEFYQDFRGGQRLHPSLRYYVPEGDEVTKYEAEGLRITLPAQRPLHHPAEVSTTFPLTGDFEITGTFELLSAHQPVKGYGVGVSLNIADSEERNKFAKISRAKLVGVGSVFHSESWAHKQGVPFQIRSKPTNARVGQLRLARMGASLRYLAADGLKGDFQEIFAQPNFGAEDMNHFRFVVADSGAPGNPIDARLIDLRIRSSNLASDLAASGASDPPAGAGKEWLAAGLVFGLLLTLTTGAVLWFRLRKQHPAGGKPIAAPPSEGQGQLRAASEFVTGKCLGCGKTLKGKAEFAGRKVKCPQCGQVVLLADRHEPAISRASALPTGSPAETPTRSSIVAIPLVVWASTALLSLAGLGLVVAFLLHPPVRSEELSPGGLSHDFRGSQPLPSFLTLDGPDADTFVRMESEGLRITLPATRQGWAPVGIASTIRLAGDFEITASYELLSADQPAKGHGAGIALNVADAHEVTKLGKVGRFRRVVEGDVYVSEYWPRHSSEDYHLRCTPTVAHAGQLRLVREGSILRCLVKESTDSDFREIDRFPFTDEEMNLVRFVANNNGSPSGVDARLLDLNIQCEQMKSIETLDLNKGWLTVALMLGLLSCLCVLLGLWSWMRRRVAMEVSAPAC